MLKKRKTANGGEDFKLMRTSLLMTCGDLRNGDFRQDFCLLSDASDVDVEVLGLTLGCQAVRHPEVLELLKMAVKVASDPDTWEAEKIPQRTVDWNNLA